MSVKGAMWETLGSNDLACKAAQEPLWWLSRGFYLFNLRLRWSNCMFHAALTEIYLIF